jgi:hypothetical protein
MAQKCVHQGCGKVYADPEEKCEYHPGPPVFHEGQKGMFTQAGFVLSTSFQTPLACLHLPQLSILMTILPS